MAVSWSNPNPSDATAAALGNAAHIQPIDIGSIVSSIMRFRQQEAARQQEEQQQTIAAVAKGVSGVEQGIQQNNANDAANATMYGVQYPNDPYGGFNDPNKVPDYGGTSALKMLESAKNMGGYVDPQTQALRAAQLDAEQALAHNRWTYPTGSDGSDLVDFRKQQIINEVDMNRARKTLEETLGVTGKEADQAIADLQRYSPGKPFPAIGDHPAISDASEGGYKDRLLAAAKEYSNQVSGIQTRQPVSTSITPPSTSLPRGVRQDDVAQAAGATGRGEDGKPIQGTTSSNTTPDKKGAGPEDSDITYLKSHPDQAANFDKRFGAGAAATYLQ